MNIKQTSTWSFFSWKTRGVHLGRHFFAMKTPPWNCKRFPKYRDLPNVPHPQSGNLPKMADWIGATLPKSPNFSGEIWIWIIYPDQWIFEIARWNCNWGYVFFSTSGHDFFLVITDGPRTWYNPNLEKSSKYAISNCIPSESRMM